MEEGPDPGTRVRRRGGIAIAAVVVIALIVAGIWWITIRKNELTASAVCGQLNRDGVTVAEGERIVVDAVDQHGIDPGELEAKCGTLLNAVGMGTLRKNVTVQVSFCHSDSIAGIVVNDNDTTVDVTLHYDLLKADGSRRHEGEVIVDAVRPGQTGTWVEPVSVEYSDCRVAVGTVRPTL